MALTTTLGRLAANEHLPQDMRDYDREWTGAEIKKIQQDLAERHPEEYVERMHGLSDLAWRNAQRSGGFSFSIQDLKKPAAVKAMQDEYEAKLGKIASSRLMDPAEKKAAIIALARDMQAKQTDLVFEEALKAGNPLAYQVLTGTRGNRSQLSRLIGSDALYSDHKDNPIPMLILRSFAQGISPAEYIASTYGARRGVVDTKLSVQRAGYFGNIMNQVAHRLVVTDLDEPESELGKNLDSSSAGAPRGLPVGTDDADSVGSLLAVPVGGYDRNTVITEKILSDLRKRGIEGVLVRSPITAKDADGGLLA